MKSKPVKWVAYIPTILLVISLVLILALFYFILRIQQQSVVGAYNKNQSPETFLNAASDTVTSKRGFITPHGSKVCDPGCCPSTLSCSTGCVCENQEDRAFFETRGNNAQFFQED